MLMICNFSYIRVFYFFTFIDIVSKDKENLVMHELEKLRATTAGRLRGIGNGRFGGQANYPAFTQY